MWRRSVLLLCVGATGCVDWRALYAVRVDDAGVDANQVTSSETEDAPDDSGLPPLPIEPDAAPNQEASPCLASPADPIVLWEFGHATVGINFDDAACALPKADLWWNADRMASLTTSDAVYLDGAFLEVPGPGNNDLGKAVRDAKSFSLELWLKPPRTTTGTIIATYDE